MKKKENATAFSFFYKKRFFSKSQQSCSQGILFPSLHRTLTSAKNRHVFGCGRRALSVLLSRNCCAPRYTTCATVAALGLEVLRSRQKKLQTERQLRHSKGGGDCKLPPIWSRFARRSPSRRKSAAAYVYIYIYVYTYICIYVYICICICIYIYIYVCIYIVCV